MSSIQLFGHVKAIEKLNSSKNGYFIYNLGTGKGYSVLDIVHTFEKVSGKKINYKFTKRRTGDVAIYLTSPAKAKAELGFEAAKDLKDMCYDAWNYAIHDRNMKEV